MVSNADPSAAVKASASQISWNTARSNIEPECLIDPAYKIWSFF